MASNVADNWIILPPQVASTVATEIDFTGALAVKAVYPIPSKCQVKEWGVIITTAFSANAADPIIRLARRPLITGTIATIQSLTLGSSNTTLRKYTTNPDVVAAGGPGTVTVGPALGGHTSALTADTDLSVGVIVLGDTKSLPSVVLSPGDLLVVELTTAATTGGKGVVFVRLEPAGEQYTTAFVQYDATP